MTGAVTGPAPAATQPAARQRLHGLQGLKPLGVLQAPAPLPNSKPGEPRFPPTRHEALLIALCRANRWRRGVEVGLLKGKTFDALLSALPELRLTGVDRWEHCLDALGEDWAETYARFDMAAAEATCRAHAARHGKRARILKGDSAAMAAEVPDGSLDFVFLDAGHTERAVAADIAAWAPKVKRRGAILGHDWWFPSVRAALDAALPGWLALPDSVWALPKAWHDEDAAA